MPLSLVWAAEWTVLPSIGVTGMYNDNLLMTTQPHDATYGFWVSPAAELTGKTENLRVSSQAKVSFASYYGGDPFNFTNYFLPLSVRYQTEKDLLAFTGGYIRDNTLLGELLDTGLVVRFTQRNQWTANPTWTRKITEKLSSQAGFRFNDTSYEDASNTGLRDYQLYGGSGGLLYQVTEKDQLQLSGTYMNFHTINSPTPVRSSIPGVNLALTHAFTETLTGTVYGGPSFVSSTANTASGNVTAHNTVWLFGANITKKFEQTSVQLEVGRSIVPSGVGLLVQVDRAGMTVSHNLTEALTASFNGFANKTSAISSQASAQFPEQHFLSATPAITWKFAEWWKVELSYSYRYREVDGVAGISTGTATSNSTMFTLSYNYW
ncbi:MAG: outer membrane beta-barrel protein [Nitrospirae bacterium]|nr:outer membrane beta-barrel protein [Nitrospirota bacterium]